MSQNNIDTMGEFSFAPMPSIGLPPAAWGLHASAQFGAKIEPIGDRHPWEHGRGKTSADVDKTSSDTVDAAQATGVPTPFLAVDPRWTDTVLLSGTQPPHHYQRFPDLRASYESAAKGRRSFVSPGIGADLHLHERVQPIHGEDSALVKARHAGTRGGLNDSHAAAAADVSDRSYHARMTHAERHAQSEALEKYEKALALRQGGVRKQRNKVALTPSVRRGSAARKQTNVTNALLSMLGRELPDVAETVNIEAASDEVVKTSMDTAWLADMLIDVMRAVTSAAYRQADTLRTRESSGAPVAFSGLSNGIALTA